MAGLKLPTQPVEQDDTATLQGEVVDYDADLPFLDKPPADYPPPAAQAVAPITSAPQAVSLPEQSDDEDADLGLFGDDDLFDDMLPLSYRSFPTIKLQTGKFVTSDERVLASPIKVRIMLNDSKLEWIVTGRTPDGQGGSKVADPLTDMIRVPSKSATKPPSPDMLIDDGVTTYGDALDTLKENFDDEYITPPQCYLRLTAVVVEAYEMKEEDGVVTQSAKPSALVGNMVYLQIPPKAGRAEIDGYLKWTRAQYISEYGKTRAGLEAMNSHVTQFGVGKETGKSDKRFTPWTVRKAA